MTRVDWIALGLIGVTALVGLRRGLIATALALGGLVAGAVLGARMAPHLLSGGARSPWTPAVGLGGALLGASVLHGIASFAGSIIRGGLRIPGLRSLDTMGGLILGALAGAAIVWALGAAALEVPGQKRLREEAQRSKVLQRLNSLVPPARLLHALARFDPFPSIAGPAPPEEPPSDVVLGSAEVKAAEAGVVRVVGTACGLSVAGSGWVAEPELVVTAAHVVAGEKNTKVELAGSGRPLPARAIAFDPRNDVAILRVHGLALKALPLAGASDGDPAAVAGYPRGGPLDVRPARVGQTATVQTDDAYGRGPVTRMVTSVRADIRHGDSGAPVLAATGEVVATIFAAAAHGGSGYGVPAEVVRRALALADGPVSTGPCVR